MEHNQTPRDVPSPSPEQQHCPSPSGEIPPAKPTAKERETEEKEKGIKKVKEGKLSSSLRGQSRRLPRKRKKPKLNLLGLARD